MRKFKKNYLAILLIVLTIMLFIVSSIDIKQIGKVSDIDFIEILTPNIIENIL